MFAQMNSEGSKLVRHIMSVEIVTYEQRHIDMITHIILDLSFCILPDSNVQSDGCQVPSSHGLGGWKKNFASVQCCTFDKRCHACQTTNVHDVQLAQGKIFLKVSFSPKLPQAAKTHCFSLCV